MDINKNMSAASDVFIPAGNKMMDKSMKMKLDWVLKRKVSLEMMSEFKLDLMSKLLLLRGFSSLFVMFYIEHEYINTLNIFTVQ